MTLAGPCLAQSLPRWGVCAGPDGGSLCGAGGGGEAVKLQDRHEVSGNQLVTVEADGSVMAL
jgi:hypothetical protein